MRVVEFIEKTTYGLNQDQVSVTAALHASVRRDGIGPKVALVAIVKRHVDPLRVWRDRRVRYTVIGVGAKVRMYRLLRSHGLDVRIRMGVPGQLVDGSVPNVIGWEDGAAVQHRSVDCARFHRVGLGHRRGRFPVGVPLQLSEHDEASCKNHRNHQELLPVAIGSRTHSEHSLLLR